MKTAATLFLALALAYLANCTIQEKSLKNSIEAQLKYDEIIASEIKSGKLSGQELKDKLDGLGIACNRLEGWVKSIKCTSGKKDTDKEKQIVEENEAMKTKAEEQVKAWRSMIEEKSKALKDKKSEIKVSEKPVHEGLNDGSNNGNSTGQDKKESSDKKKGTVDQENGSHEKWHVTETKGQITPKNKEEGKKTDEDGCCTTTRWIVGTISTLLAAGGAGLGFWMVRRKRRSMLLP